MRKHLPIIVLLASALVIGLLILPQFGESWDEADIRRYSAYALGAYAYLPHPRDLAPFETNLNFYGPGYFVAADLMSRAIQWIQPGWSLVTAWHAVYFLTFLAGAAFLYLLARRCMSDLAAFGATLLFITQPLLWGHAFINPKDIPFLTFFAGTVYFGLKMVDDLAQARLIRPSLVIAALMLGLTSTLRLTGPLAGVLVLAYAAWRLRTRILLPAAVYLVIACIAAFLCWPYVWADPMGRLLDSLQVMAQFPFQSPIMFAGKLYPADQLPASYFPVILGIQLTESAIPLIVAGLVLSVVAFTRGENRGSLLLLAAWFIVPTAVIVGSRRPIYDNARQLFFVLPPLFIASGLALDKLFQFLRRPVLQGAVLLALALPGVLLGVRLHPYEYVYYNILVGGTGGAFEGYEMDYWGTSLDEIGRHLNATAPPEAKILVFGPSDILAGELRPGLQVYLPRDGSNRIFDYVVLLARSRADLGVCKDAETIFAVSRRGAILSELRSIPPGVTCE
jgi:hypothetical protein